MNFKKGLAAIFVSFIAFNAPGQIYKQYLKYDSISSVNLGYKRYFKVFAPTDYFEQAGKKFNVVYLLDGQSDKLLDLVISNFNYMNGESYNGYPPFIIVAIETDEKRSLEFTPHTNDSSTVNNYLFKTYGYGNADRYLNFIEKELFPHIKKHYNVTNHRIGIGHSLAGTLLMHALNTRPDMFGAYFLFSPNLEFGNQQLVTAFKKQYTNGSALNKFLYVSVGDDSNYERRFRKGVKQLDSLLQKGSIKNFVSEVDYIKNCNHYESPQLSLPLALSIYKDLYAYPSQDSLKAFLNNKNMFLAQIHNFYQEKAKYLGYLYCPSIDVINNEFAYFALNNSKTNAALEVINWGITLYPNNYFSYSLYLVKSDILKARNDLEGAIKACTSGLKILETTKNAMLPEDYQYALADVKEKLIMLEDEVSHN